MGAATASPQNHASDRLPENPYAICHDSFVNLGPFNLGPFNLGPFNLGPFNQRYGF
jgi:hypothetical protein